VRVRSRVPPIWAIAAERHRRWSALAERAVARAGWPCWVSRSTLDVRLQGEVTAWEVELLAASPDRGAIPPWPVASALFVEFGLQYGNTTPGVLPALDRIGDVPAGGLEVSARSGGIVARISESCLLR
jgi:hypothetical protein